MKRVSPIDALNAMFPLNVSIDYMPVTACIDDLKDGILKLSEIMISMPKDDREQMSDILVCLSGACKLLTDMRTAALTYATMPE